MPYLSHIPTRRDQILRRMELLQGQLDRLDSMPEEPMDDEGNGLIWFEKRYSKETCYIHAAVRIPSMNKWHATGRYTASAYTWEELLCFISSNERVMPVIWWSTEMEQLA